MCNSRRYLTGQKSGSSPVHRPNVSRSLPARIECTKISPLGASGELSHRRHHVQPRAGFLGYFFAARLGTENKTRGGCNRRNDASGDGPLFRGLMSPVDNGTIPNGAYHVNIYDAPTLLKTYFIREFLRVFRHLGREESLRGRNRKKDVD